MASTAQRPVINMSRANAVADALLKGAGPFIGPKGGRWADAAHTIPWHEPTIPTAHMGRLSEIAGRSMSRADLKAAGYRMLAGSTDLHKYGYSIKHWFKVSNGDQVIEYVPRSKGSGLPRVTATKYEDQVTIHRAVNAPVKPPGGSDAKQKTMFGEPEPGSRPLRQEKLRSVRENKTMTAKEAARELAPANRSARPGTLPPSNPNGRRIPTPKSTFSFADGRSIDWKARGEQHGREVQAIKKRLRERHGGVFSQYGGLGASEANSLRADLERHRVAGQAALLENRAPTREEIDEALARLKKSLSLDDLLKAEQLSLFGPAPRLTVKGQTPGPTNPYGSHAPKSRQLWEKGVEFARKIADGGAPPDTSVVSLEARIGKDHAVLKPAAIGRLVDALYPRHPVMRIGDKLRSIAESKSGIARSNSPTKIEKIKETQQFWYGVYQFGSYLHGTISEEAQAQHATKEKARVEDAYMALRESAATSGPPGHGWQAIPHGTKGGFRRKHGGDWEYWYPGAAKAPKPVQAPSAVKDRLAAALFIRAVLDAMANPVPGYHTAIRARLAQAKALGGKFGEDYRQLGSRERIAELQAAQSATTTPADPPTLAAPPKEEGPAAPRPAMTVKPRRRKSNSPMVPSTGPQDSLPFRRDTRRWGRIRTSRRSGPSPTTAR